MAEGSTEPEKTSPIREARVFPDLPEGAEDLDSDPGEGEPREGSLMSRLVAGLLEKTVKQSGFRDEVDRYIDGKREQTLQAARSEADGFLEDWLARIERRIDHKLVEIEDKIDEQIEKELRAKVWILILTLGFSLSRFHKL